MKGTMMQTDAEFEADIKTLYEMSDRVMAALAQVSHPDEVAARIHPTPLAHPTGFFGA
jgi:hypothetical protein